MFIHLQRLVTKRHRAETASVDSKASGNKDSSIDIPFLNEIKGKWKDICNQLLHTEGQRYNQDSIPAIYPPHWGQGGSSMI